MFSLYADKLVFSLFYSLLQSNLPFAVVGSNDEVKIGNKMVKARQYPWGTVQGQAWLSFY